MVDPSVKSPRAPGDVKMVAPVPIPHAFAYIDPIQDSRRPDKAFLDRPIYRALIKLHPVVFRYMQELSGFFRAFHDYFRRPDSNAERFLNEHVHPAFHCNASRNMVVIVRGGNQNRLYFSFPFEHRPRICINSRRMPRELFKTLRHIGSTTLDNIAYRYSPKVPKPRVPKQLKAATMPIRHPPATNKRDVSIFHIPLL
jgi:hypothetical protein